MRKLQLVSSLVALLASASAIDAANYVPVPAGLQVIPAPGSGIPGPRQVPGKEFSDRLDKNDAAVPVAVPGQTLLWDGLGGTRNGLLFCPAGTSTCEIDAMANNSDALFGSLVSNTSALVFNVARSNDFLLETIGGAFGVWALDPIIDANGVGIADDVELWGPEGFSDTDRVSIVGDVAAGCSAYNTTGACIFTPLDIALAIGRRELQDFIEVDALMWNPGRILFSIAPIAGAFDGGEIWVWDGPGFAATFLFHGGHLWDTAFDVTSFTGGRGEDVIALEAVSFIPEPGTYALMGMGLLALGLGLRRRG